MSSCNLPPCPPCPPTSPPVCPQVCPPPPPPAPCHGKPIMRGLHWAQTQRNMMHAFVLAAIAGFLGFGLLAFPRRERYRDFYAKAEMDDWADEMARKGLFQGVPSDKLKDKTS